MKHASIQHFEYHAWANRRLFDHLDTLPDEIFTQPVQSVFPTIREVLVHIYQVDTMWLSVMSGYTFRETMAHIEEHKEKSADRSKDELRTLFDEAERSYISFFEQLDDPDVEMTIHHPRFGSMKSVVAELVHHVVNHGTYHRGNITAMLRQMGQSGVPTDYVFFLAGQDPSAEKEATDSE